MSKHGNSHENKNPHFLYGIFERETEDILKYGITDDPIEEDGLPYTGQGFSCAGQTLQPVS